MKKYMKSLPLLLLTIIMIDGCTNSIFYTVDLVNYGKYGVTYIKFPYDPLPSGEMPGLPGVRDDIRTGYSFYGNRTKLPKEPIEIVWQLNGLTNCKNIIGPYKSHDPDYPGMFTSKMGCTWTPIPGKIYRKVIDIQQLVKGNEHARRAGEKDEGFFSLSGRRIMIITFVFIDDKLDVKIGTFVSNPYARYSPETQNIRVVTVQYELDG